MLRISWTALIAALSIAGWTMAQNPQPLPNLPGATTPINGFYSHAASEFQTTNVPGAPAMPVHQTRYIRTMATNTCPTCGLYSVPGNCNTGACPTCNTGTCNTGHGRRQHPKGNRIWDWLTWSPKSTVCDWHSEISPCQPPLVAYVKCHPGPGYSCSCPERPRHEWNLFKRAKSDCASCATPACSTNNCSTGACGTNACSPVMGTPNYMPAPYPPVPASNAVPTRLPTQQMPTQQIKTLPNTTSMYPPTQQTGAMTPTNMRTQMIPGFRSTPVQGQRYAPEGYPQPVRADYRLPPISMPLGIPNYPGR